MHVPFRLFFRHIRTALTFVGVAIVLLSVTPKAFAQLTCTDSDGKQVNIGDKCVSGTCQNLGQVGDPKCYNSAPAPKATCSDGTPADGKTPCKSDPSRICLPNGYGGGVSCQPNPTSTATCSDGTPADGKTPCKSDPSRICLPNGYGGGVSCQPKSAFTPPSCPDGTQNGQTCLSDPTRVCVTNGAGGGASCIPKSEVNLPSTPIDYTFYLCKQAGNDAQKTACEACVGPGTDAKKIWTALGCIPVNGTSILTTLVRIGLSIAGGVALLMIIAASFMLSTSQGEQKRVGEARELLTSAVIGLLFIIFSVTILQFIGVSILHIPGFGS